MITTMMRDRAREAAAEPFNTRTCSLWTRLPSGVGFYQCATDGSWRLYAYEAPGGFMGGAFNVAGVWEVRTLTGGERPSSCIVRDNEQLAMLTLQRLGAAMVSPGLPGSAWETLQASGRVRAWEDAEARSPRRWRVDVDGVTDLRLFTYQSDAISAGIRSAMASGEGAQ